MADRTGWGRGSTRRWRQFRRAVLAEDPRCASCLRRGIVTLATQVHHRISIRRGGGEFDRDNVEPICTDCHQRETTASRTGRVRGAAADGRPRDPNHPWNKS